jgi:hypothetical protein
MKPSTVLLAASGWIALAATALPPLSPVRVAVTLFFIALCPGIAVLRIVGVANPGHTVQYSKRQYSKRQYSKGTYEPLPGAALTVAASLALATLVSEVFFLAGGFTMPRCVMALSVLTGVLALLPELIERYPRHAAARHRRAAEQRQR